MAVTLMTTTGTLEDVQSALGLAPAPTAAQPVPGQVAASVEALPTPTVPGTDPVIPTEPEPVAAAPSEPPVAADDHVPDSEFDEDGEPITERAARSSRTKLQTIKHLRTRARTAETALARAQGELEAMRRVAPASPDQPPQALPEPALPSAPDPNEPKEADYATYESFIESRADYRARKAVREELAADRQRADQQAQQTTVKTRIATFAEAHPDYYEKVNNPDLVLTEPIALTLQHSDDGPALAYALASDPARFKQIAAMHPVLAIRALGELGAELKSKTSTPAAKPVAVAPTPSAPPPPTPVRGTSVAGTVSLEDFAATIQPGDNATSEWLRRRNEQLARTGRR